MSEANATKVKKSETLKRGTRKITRNQNIKPAVNALPNRYRSSTGYGRTVSRQMGVVRHDEGDLHDARIENSRKEQKARRRDMDKVGLEVLNNFSALHFGQINRQ